MARAALDQKSLPNIACPTRLREKRIWRLIFDRNPLFALFGDKLAAKDWMVQRAPGLLAARTLWSVRDVADLPPDALRAGIVIKANNGWNQNLFLHETPDNTTAIKAVIAHWLSEPYRERHGKRYWPSSELVVFGEEVVVSQSGPLIDFNVFCCNGTAAFAVVTVGEKTRDERIAYFSAQGQRITSIMEEPTYQRDWLPLDFPLPARFADAVTMAAKLSEGIDFVRVDIMALDDRLYACEMSPLPGTGAYDTTRLFREWNASWDLRQAWFMQNRRRGMLEHYRQILGRRFGARI